MTPADGVGLVDSTELDLPATIEAMLAEVERQHTVNHMNHSNHPEGDRA